MRACLAITLLSQQTHAWVSNPRARRAPSKLAAESTKVTVLGGTGFVGSRVCKELVAAGASVTSVSKSGAVPDWCKSEPWASSVEWKANDLTRGARESLEAAVGKPDALVSCVGSVGFDVQGLLLGNAMANEAAAAAAAKVGTPRYVYCSVASEVAACEDGWLPGYFQGYFKGKRRAEAAFAAAAAANGGTVYLVKPSFIYGGEDFGLLPPRVNYGYGAGVEELLSKGFFTGLADFLPGLLKVALRPPVSVDAVAAALANAALDGSAAASAEVDGTAAINAATGQPPATALSEFLASTSEKVKELTNKQ